MSLTSYVKTTDLNYMHDWYLRAADSVKAMTGSNSGASRLLEYYLTPTKQVHNQEIVELCKSKIDPKKVNIKNNAGTYILDDQYLEKVKDVTEYKTNMEKRKKIFLSEAENLTGVISHFQKRGKKEEYELEWLDTVSLDPKLKDYLKNKAGKFDPTKEELADEVKKQLDVYAGLNTFIIWTRVVIKINKVEPTVNDEILQFQGDRDFKPKYLNVSIKSWKNTLLDYYDFNGQFGFYIINPDYGIKDGLFPEKSVVGPAQLTHISLVKMTKTNPPLASEFCVYKEFDETDKNLLVQNYNVKWRDL